MMTAQYLWDMMHGFMGLIPRMYLYYVYCHFVHLHSLDLSLSRATRADQRTKNIEVRTLCHAE